MAGYEAFNSEDLFEVINKGYKDIFASIKLAGDVKYNDTLPIDKNGPARKLYEQHGYFDENGDYFLSDDQPVTVECENDQFGIIFPDSIEFIFSKKNLPSQFLVQFSDLGNLVLEFTMKFQTDMYQSLEYIFWIRNKVNKQ